MKTTLKNKGKAEHLTDEPPKERQIPCLRTEIQKIRRNNEDLKGALEETYSNPNI